MLIGVPKEIKNNEFRVGLTPGSVAELTTMATRCWSRSRRGVGLGLARRGIRRRRRRSWSTRRRKSSPAPR